VHLTPDLLSLGIQARGHRQRSVLDRSDDVAQYTVHTYNGQLAEYVYSRLAEAARRFRAVLDATAIGRD
jgi:hypothetical protein